MNRQKLGDVIFGVRFTLAQGAALDSDNPSPRWDLHPPQREEYDDDRAYAIGLRDYADRLIAANKAPAMEKKDRIAVVDRPILVNNGFWDRPAEERGARMEAACKRNGASSFWDLSPEERGKAYDDED